MLIKYLWRGCLIGDIKRQLLRTCTSGYTKVVVRQVRGDREIYIKRDDLFFNHGVNGNKARKFHYFGHMKPFPRIVFRFVHTLLSERKKERMLN